MTTGEITDQAPDYRPDGVRRGDLTRSYRGQCNTVSEAQLSVPFLAGGLTLVHPPASNPMVGKCSQELLIYFEFN